MKTNFRTIFAALFAMMLMVFAMPQKAHAADKSCGVTIKVNSYSSPFYNPNTKQHTVNSVSETNYIKQSEAGGGNNYNNSSARAYFTGSNADGWSLVVEITVGNCTKTINPYGNAKIYNKDMSNAGGSVTFGVSYSTMNPSVSTSISISGGVDFPLYTLSYDANGGQNAPAQQKINSGSTPVNFTIASQTPTRENYNFLGWSESSTAATPTYQPNGTFSTSIQDNTLYAVWKRIPLPGNLTISCEGLQNEESAVIEVKNGDSQVLYRVSVSSDSPSVTIKGVSVGTYTVAPMAWSWTYERMDSKSVTIEEEQTASVSFTAVKKTSIEQKYDENKKVVK
ncbi:MAG: InlB B-repeat-containing protein [Bacteroidales bacterium]|nr:InlB B-repeat-containing protein [Candidatus Egerieousia equi]